MPTLLYPVMNCRIQKQISTIPRSNQRSLKLSLDFAIAAALGRYPMATLRGSFAKVVVVDQPLCQELRGFVTLLPHLTGFYTTFLKRNKEQVLTSGKTDAQMFFHFILQHKVMIPLSIVLHGSYQKFLYNIGAVRDCMCMYIEVYRYMLILIQIQISTTSRTLLSKWSKEIMKSQWRQLTQVLAKDALKALLCCEWDQDLSMFDTYRFPRPWGNTSPPRVIGPPLMASSFLTVYPIIQWLGNSRAFCQLFATTWILKLYNSIIIPKYSKRLGSHTQENTLQCVLEIFSIDTDYSIISLLMDFHRMTILEPAGGIDTDRILKAFCQPHLAPRLPEQAAILVLRGEFLGIHGQLGRGVPWVSCRQEKVHPGRRTQIKRTGCANSPDLNLIFRISPSFFIHRKVCQTLNPEIPNTGRD